MLNIVNEVLAKSIDRFLSDETDPLNSRMMNKRYPFVFPYHFAHHQCQLALETRQTPLGDISYRTSLSLPLKRDHSNNYGVHPHGSGVAQMLLCGMSPDQQTLIIEPTQFADFDPAQTATADTVDLFDEQTQAFFMRHYGVHAISMDHHPLNSLDTFMAQTGLDAQAVEALLATGQSAPMVSPNGRFRTGSRGAQPYSSQYGARYVNAINAQAQRSRRSDHSMSLLETGEGSGKRWYLTNTSPQRFDRMQRMIRLQRWMGIPFAELDTLIVAAMHAEGEANPQMLMNENTLRVLGVFRHMKQRYSIEAEEFAALLHHLSPRASAGRLPLFDAVFNTPMLFDTPLTLDRTALELSSNSPQDHQTLFQICASLGLTPTASSLERVLNNTSQHVGPLSRSLSTVSSFYRQARIAKMFDLSVEDSLALVDLLGGDTYEKALTRGTLRTGGDAPDLLDILMQMDWAVTWLKQSKQDVATARNGAGLQADTLVVTEDLVEQLTQLHQQVNQTAIHDTPLRLVEQFLQELTQIHPGHAQVLLEWARLSVEQFVIMLNDAVTRSQVSLENFDPALLTALTTLSQRAQLTTALNLSEPALRTFIASAAWLGAPLISDSPALAPMYLLERYNHLIHEVGVQDAKLLGYLHRANAQSSPLDNNELNAQLAALLNWDPSELKAHARHLPEGKAVSVAEIDWLYRCQQAGLRSGLSADTLQRAMSLGPKSSIADWQALGNAAAAALTTHR